MGPLTCSSSFMLPGAVCWQKYGHLAAEGLCPELPSLRPPTTLMHMPGTGHMQASFS